MDAKDAPPITPFFPSSNDKARGFPPKIPLPPNSNGVDKLLDVEDSPMLLPPRVPEVNDVPMRGNPIWRFDPDMLDPDMAPMRGTPFKSEEDCLLKRPDPEPTED